MDALTQALRTMGYAIKWFHIPNEADRGAAGQKNAVAKGLKIGACDNVILIPGGSLHIELKSDVGRMGEGQEEWIEDCKHCGHPATVIRARDVLWLRHYVSLFLVAHGVPVPPPFIYREPIR